VTEELEGYLRQIDAVTQDAHALVAGLSDAQFGWRPGTGRWSVAECLDHLNRSIALTLPAFDRSIADARARELRGRGPFRYGWFAKWLVRDMEPPARRRYRTVNRLVPGSDGRTDAVHQEFVALREALARRVRDADGLDLKRAKVQSPVTRLLRMPLGAYFAMILAHDRRHLWQANQVRAAAGFPRV